MKSREIESLLTRIVQKTEPIRLEPFSNLVYIIEALFSHHNIYLPITFDYSFKGFISDDLKFILERLSNKEIITIDHQSPSIIKLGKKEREEEIEEFLLKYPSIVEKINILLEQELKDQEIINLAKIVRVNKILKMGIIEESNFQNRIDFDRINIERMDEIIASSNLRGIIITPSQR